MDTTINNYNDIKNEFAKTIKLLVETKSLSTSDEVEINKMYQRMVNKFKRKLIEEAEKAI